MRNINIHFENKLIDLRKKKNVKTENHMLFRSRQCLLDLRQDQMN